MGLLEAVENVYQNLNKNSFWFWVSPACSKAVSSCSTSSQLLVNVKKVIMPFYKAMTTLESARSFFCQFANTVDSGMFATAFLVHIEIVVWRELNKTKEIRVEF